MFNGGLDVSGIACLLPSLLLDLCPYEAALQPGPSFLTGPASSVLTANPGSEFQFTGVTCIEDLGDFTLPSSVPNSATLCLVSKMWLCNGEIQQSVCSINAGAWGGTWSSEAECVFQARKLKECMERRQQILLLAWTAQEKSHLHMV